MLLGNALPVWPAGAQASCRTACWARRGWRCLFSVSVRLPWATSRTRRKPWRWSKAIDLGVTYIDTAPARTSVALKTWYERAHDYLKSVLKERRDEVFVVTKCFEIDGEKALATLKKNLVELGIEQADVVYTHSIGHAVYDFDALVGDHGPMAASRRRRPTA